MQLVLSNLELYRKSYKHFTIGNPKICGNGGFVQFIHIVLCCMVRMAQSPTQIVYLGVIFQIQKDLSVETKGTNDACKP